jgi:hypothetical protein
VHLVLPRLSQDLDRLGHPHLQGAAMISGSSTTTNARDTLWFCAVCSKAWVGPVAHVCKAAR